MGGKGSAGVLVLIVVLAITGSSTKFSLAIVVSCNQLPLSFAYGACGKGKGRTGMENSKCQSQE